MSHKAIVQTRRVAPDDGQARKYLLARHVMHAHTRVVHDTRCAALATVPLGRVIAANVAAPPPGSRLCTHCLLPRPTARRRPAVPVGYQITKQLLRLRRTLFVSPEWAATPAADRRQILRELRDAARRTP